MFNDFDILNTYTAAEATGFTVIGAIFMAAMIVVFACSICDNNKVAIFSIILIGMGLIFTLYSTVEVTYYEVTFDKTISSDVFDKYEIIDQQGKIFTIREVGYNERK